MHYQEPTLEVQLPDKEYPATFDKDGFINEPELWDRNVARKIAQSEWINELRSTHWQVIEFVRCYYSEKGAAPLMRQVCRKISLSKYQSVGLFSGCLQVWKIAGLPNPGEEARGHMH